MDMNKMILILTFLIAFHLKNFAQDAIGFKDTSEVINVCNKISKHFMNDEISEVFNKIRIISELPSDEIDFLEKKTIEQLNLLENRYGKCLSIKLVKKQLVEDVLFNLLYVIKYEKHGLRLQYTFYNGKNDRWYLNNFKWDDKLSSLVE
jgi:hypothetical protein